MNKQDTVPYELYIKQGDAEVTPSVVLNKHSVEVEKGSTVTLQATTVPAGQTVTWSSSSSTIASVTSGGVVTGELEGNAIITASITVNGISYTDTCTVIVNDTEE